MSPIRIGLLVAPLMLSSTVAAAQGGGPTPERHGFTILLDLGVGIQKDQEFESTALGLGGLNLGIGGFVNPRTAVLFRFSGTNVNHDLDFEFFPVNQVSGVGGVTVQRWITDQFTVEAGAGFGFWKTDFESETGLGIIFRAAAVVFSRGRHSLDVGVNYAPAFTDLDTVHNVGITFGYQFHR